MWFPRVQETSKGSGSCAPKYKPFVHGLHLKSYVCLMFPILEWPYVWPAILGFRECKWLSCSHYHSIWCVCIFIYICIYIYIQTCVYIYIYIILKVYSWYHGRHHHAMAGPRKVAGFGSAGNGSTCHRPGLLRTCGHDLGKFRPKIRAISTQNMWLIWVIWLI